MLDYDHCRPEKWNIFTGSAQTVCAFFYLCFCNRVTRDSDMLFLRLSVGAVSPWEEVKLKYQVLSQMQGVLLNAILAVFTFPVGKGFTGEWCPVFFPSLSHFLQLFCFPSIRISHSHTLPHVLILIPVLQHPWVSALIYTKKTFTKLQVQVL